MVGFSSLVRPRADALGGGRCTWGSYQPAARAAFTDLARQHNLDMYFRDDVPFEVVCTYPSQAGLSFEITLALDQGTIHCWGAGWSFDSLVVGNSGIGLPPDVRLGLNALISGRGRLLLRTVYGATSSFWTSLQVQQNSRWRTIRRQAGLPFPPLWRRTLIRNQDSRRSHPV